MFTFFGVIVVFWVFFIIWWGISPRHFPFFAKHNLNRWHIISFNIVAYTVVLVLVANFIPAPPKGAEPSVGETLGLLVGFGVLVLFVVLSIKAKKSNNTQPLSQPIPPVQAPVAPQSSVGRQLAQMSDQARRRLERKLEQKRSQSSLSEKVKQRKKAVISRIAQIPLGRITTGTVARPVSPKPSKPQRKEDFKLGDDNLCTMTYQKPDGERSVRLVIIKQLKANKYGDWVMWAIDINDGYRVKSFRVDRITKLEHNNQKWTKYDDILGIVRTFECLA